VLLPPSVLLRVGTDDGGFDQMSGGDCNPFHQGGGLCTQRVPGRAHPAKVGRDDAFEEAPA
jgi:hypothetical protein